MEKKIIKRLSFSFLPIPEELMKSKALSFGAKFLFGIIAKANRESVRWSVEYLSRRMDCTPRETRRRIGELKSSNLILVLPRKGRVNDYIINLELIEIIQTSDSPDRTVRSQSGQERDDRSGQESPDYGGQSYSKEHSLKKINEEDSDLKNLEKLNRMKSELIRKKTMPHSWQTDAQEEAAAKIRPSGIHT